MRNVARLFRDLVLFVIVLACTLHVSGSSAHGQNEWQVGHIVGLREGTCIREGPGFRFRAHTRVPENDWAVQIIDGPRTADGRTWYDTSRRAAGDPSGGTGWVDASQTDVCPKSEPPSAPPPAPAPAPAPPTSPSDRWHDIERWWNELPSIMKWMGLVLVVAVLMAGTRNGALLKFVLLGLLALLCYWFADLSRSTWEPMWRTLVGRDAPDLALLFAAVPFLIWFVARLRR